MGGTGNTGQDPNKLTGLSTSVDGGGATGTGSPQAPGAATPGWVPPAENAPAEMRPYELATASTGAGAAAAPVQNLGFPTTQPMGFHHQPYPVTTDVPTYAGAAPPAAGAGAGAAAADPNAKSPDDWLYPGNLPMIYDQMGTMPGTTPTTGTTGGFGAPLKYSGTGYNYTPGYGAAGYFGGVAGYGPQQKGLEDQQLLPQMAAGTQLKDAQIDQYNRIRRADYDRYMKLYGVGYDLPGYQRALNTQVAPANAIANPYQYYGSGG